MAGSSGENPRKIESTVRFSIAQCALCSDYYADIQGLVPFLYHNGRAILVVNDTLVESHSPLKFEKDYPSETFILQ